MTRRLWCEHAWLGGSAPATGVTLELDGERITSVTTGTPRPAAAERRTGLTVPGLVNVHSHAFHRALRGRTHRPTGQRGSFWTWREQMLSIASRLDPDGYRRLASAVFAEMAQAGITTVAEFHYLHHRSNGTPYDDPNEMGLAVVAAAADAGVRLTLLDSCYLHGGLGARGYLPVDGPTRRFADRSVDAWAERVSRLDGDRSTRFGAGIHSIRAVDPAAIGHIGSWASDRRAVVHAHVSEQPAENEACLALHGMSPTAALAPVLGPRFTAVHGTHVTGADMEQLGSTRSTVALCPTTERDLADGVGPARQLRDAGAEIALGTDSNAVIDLFEEARAVELDERLVTGERGRHLGESLLTMATGNGARSAGWPEAGRLEAGALADLTTVSLASVRLAGTAPETMIDAIVFAATTADVTDVTVGGRDVVSEGRHVSIDAGAELSELVPALMSS